MKPIFVLGVAAAFLGGVALTLLIGYLIPTHNVYACFWAALLGMASCVFSVGAVVLHATQKERVKVDRVIDLTVDRMLRQRGLEVVDRR